MSPLKVDQVIELQIDRLSYGGGRGVGRYQGFVVFVPQTAPNELVKVKVTEIKKSYATANVIEVLKPSLYRREAPCPVASECGGCCWQHIVYEEQLNQKQEILLKAFSRIKLSDKIDFRKIIPSKELRYRNRIQLQISNKQVGYFKKSTNDIVPITDCLIAEQEVANSISQLNAETLKQKRIEIAKTTSNEVVIRHGKTSHNSNLFAQVNTLQNQKLIEVVLKMACELNNAPVEVMDLYAGSGNLSFPLAKALPMAQIQSVELSKASVDLAKKQGLSSNIKFYASDVGLFLSKQESIKKESLFVLDPPRKGCDKRTLEQLTRLKPGSIIYIGCHLTAFSRDLEKLSEHYDIKSIQPIDMFPQTDYMECVAQLVIKA